MAEIWSGKMVAESLIHQLQERVHALRTRGTFPRLSILRCGEAPSDLAYERGVLTRAEKIGIEVEQVVLSENVTSDELVAQIHRINETPQIHGALLFRPLPAGLRREQDVICNALHPAKDVDCMTDLSLAGVFEGRTDLGFPPCTAQACIEILKYYGESLSGKRVVVIGRSLVVGKPLAMMLMAEHATVTVCHTRTVDIPSITRQAEIIITAAGALRSLTAEYVRPGQKVIDVAINWDSDKTNTRGGKGAIAGDVDFDCVEPVVAAITPVPGGVGSVTSTVLLEHVIRAAERQTADCRGQL